MVSFGLIWWKSFVKAIIFNFLTGYLEQSAIVVSTVTSWSFLNLFLFSNRLLLPSVFNLSLISCKHFISFNSTDSLYYSWVSMLVIKVSLFFIEGYKVAQVNSITLVKFVVQPLSVSEHVSLLNVEKKVACISWACFVCLILLWFRVMVLLFVAFLFGRCKYLFHSQE